MKIYETKIQKAAASVPTDLDFQRILAARDPDPSWIQAQKLKWLEDGKKGEEKVLEFLKEDGKNHWVIVRNLWLSYHDNNYEIDIALLTKHCLYLLEVKNFTGKFTYENGISKMGNGILENDPVHQARKAMLRTRKIFNSFQNPIEIKSILIFVGEKNQVLMKSPVEDITVLKLTDIYAFINDLIIEEDETAIQKIRSKDIITHLEKFEVIPPYLPKPLTKISLHQLKTGIQCSRCRNLNLIKERSYLQCKCGLHEPLKEAIVRTACEYATLAYNQKFRIGEIMHYIGGNVSRGYLRKLLKTHFKQTLKYKFTEYEIVGLPYYKTHHLYTFDSPVILRIKGRDPNVYFMD